MQTKEKITLSLEQNDVGQLLDGLEVLIEQWLDTAVYLETGEIRMDAVIRECHKAQEARSIASHYEAIRGEIRAQLG